MYKIYSVTKIVLNTGMCYRIFPLYYTVSVFPVLLMYTDVVPKYL